jgi:hypothetical protein
VTEYHYEQVYTQVQTVQKGSKIRQLCIQMGSWPEDPGFGILALLRVNNAAQGACNAAQELSGCTWNSMEGQAK